MLSELELKAYSLEWGNPSFATMARSLYERPNIRGHTDVLSRTDVPCPIYK